MKILLLLACSSTLLAQSFPSSTYTPYVAANNVQTTLTAPMASIDNVAVVASSTGWANNMLAYICDSTTSTVKCTGTYEIMKVTNVNGNVLTVTRGLGGTSAIAHSSGKAILNSPVALYNKTVNDELVAIESFVQKSYYYPNITADGSTNDAPALQSLINTLSAGNGGTILLPAGHIILSCNSCTELLKFPGPATVNLKGAGWNLNGGSYTNTELTVAASVANTVDVLRIAPGVSTNGITGMFIRDLGIISQNTSTAGRHGINVDTTSNYVKNLTISNIYIGPLPGRGIVGTNPSLVEGFYRSLIENSWIYNGMQFQKLGDSIHIVGNDLSGTGTGVEVTSFSPGAGHFDMYNNTVTTQPTFLYLGGATALTTIRDNFFEAQQAMTGSHGASIDFDCTGSQCLDIQFTGNSINLAAFSVNLIGLRINNANNTILRDNYFGRTPSTGGVNWLTTASALDTYVAKQIYSPNTDVYPAIWTDGGVSTTVETRCDPYTITGAQLNSGTNTQTFNLFAHPLGAVVSGIRIYVNTGFTATNLLTLTASVGDSATTVNQFQTAASVMTGSVVAGRTTPIATTTNYSASNVTATFVGTYSAGGTFAANPVAGSAQISVCWSLQPLTGQQ